MQVERNGCEVVLVFAQMRQCVQTRKQTFNTQVRSEASLMFKVGARVTRPEILSDRG